MRQAEQGFFLILSIIFIMVIGFLAVVLTHTFATRAGVSPVLMDGLRVFYNAESGVEIGTRLLSIPSIQGTSPIRSRCADINNMPAITNATLGGGTLTIQAENGLAQSALTILSTNITSTTTAIPLSSTSGFASAGRVVIDREAIDYNGISGNVLTGVQRGVGNSMPSFHAQGAAVAQYQCNLSVQAGIPSLDAPRAQRQIRWAVPLQGAWAAGNSTGNSNTGANWNLSQELDWSGYAYQPLAEANLKGVSMLSNGDIWFAGETAQISGADYFTLIHLRGLNILSSYVPGACPDQALNGISMVSSQEGWAVGNIFRPNNCKGGRNRYTVLKYNGSSWNILSEPEIPGDNNSNRDLNAVHVIDTSGNGVGNIGFAVGVNGDALIYNGSTWNAISTPGNQTLRGVYVVSATQAWAAGDNGTILRWDGSSWSSVSTPTNVQLNAIAMYDSDGDGQADFGIAAGNSGRILTYNGSAWSNSNTSGVDLFGVDIFDPQDAWAVGANGTAMHWNGSGWMSRNVGVSTTLNSISVSPARAGVSGWRQVFG